MLALLLVRAGVLAGLACRLEREEQEQEEQEEVQEEEEEGARRFLCGSWSGSAVSAGRKVAAAEKIRTTKP